jgi:uncharacterized protein involved in exopolysaccharide biosynthesis
METISRIKSLPSQVRAKADQSLRSKPALWAGIAAGAGFAAGVGGRLLRRKLRRRAMAPAILIVEESC